MAAHLLQRARRAQAAEARQRGALGAIEVAAHVVGVDPQEMAEAVGHERGAEVGRHHGVYVARQHACTGRQAGSQPHMRRHKEHMQVKAALHMRAHARAYIGAWLSPPSRRCVRMLRYASACMSTQLTPGFIASRTAVTAASTAL